MGCPRLQCLQRLNPRSSWPHIRNGRNTVAVKIKSILMGNIPVTTTTKIFPKILRYKWEAYCDTNGRRTAINGRSTDSISLSSERRGTESTAVQIGGVLQYKWEVYCDTFLRSSGGWGFRRSSELIPKNNCWVWDDIFWKIIRPEFFCWDISDSEFSKWQFFVDIEFWGFLRALSCMFWV